MYQRWIALRLAVLSYIVWIAGAQTTCPRISGKPSCVCKHPDGVIDLTPLANPTSNGKPRYKYMSNPTHTLLRMYSKVLYVCVLQSLVQRSQTRDAYVCASFGSGFQTKCCTPLIPDCDSQEPITRELSTVEL